MQVLRYLGRYTHRVAISNHRLLAFDRERVTFRWKDYAHGGKQGKMTLAATEFLRRFFLHVLAQGLRPHPALRISRQSVSRVATSRTLPAVPQRSAISRHAPSETPSLWHCPHCGAAMIVIHRLTAVEFSRCAYFDTS